MFDISHTVMEEQTGAFNSYSCISNDLFEAYTVMFEEIAHDCSMARRDAWHMTRRREEDGAKVKAAVVRVDWFTLPRAVMLNDKDWMVEAKLRFVIE